MRNAATRSVPLRTTFSASSRTQSIMAPELCVARVTSLGSVCSVPFTVCSSRDTAVISFMHKKGPPKPVAAGAVRWSMR